VNEEVGDEILPTQLQRMVATAHPGFYNNRTPGYPLGTPETDSRSTAWMPPDRSRPCYWAGGFNGGCFEDFMSMSKEITNRVNVDFSNGIIAVWHDESHLNAYLSERSENVKTLEPSYCYPESWSLPYPKKILALDKDHKEVRQ